MASSRQLIYLATPILAGAIYSCNAIESKKEDGIEAKINGLSVIIYKGTAENPQIYQIKNSDNPVIYANKEDFFLDIKSKNPRASKALVFR